jgi:hypothetical protein
MLYRFPADGHVRVVIMPRSSNDTDPMGGPPFGERGERESSSAGADDDTTATTGTIPRDRDVTDPDPRPFVAYDAPPENERIRALFENMETRRGGPAVDLPFTNGQLAAKFASETAQQAPAANPTPVPQPAVVLDVSPVPPPARPEPVLPRQTVRIAGAPAVPRASRNVPTLRIHRPVDAPPAPWVRRRLVLVVTIGGALLIGVVLIVGLLLRRPSDEPSAKPHSVPMTAPTPTPLPAVPAEAVTPIVPVASIAPAMTATAAPAASTSPPPTTRTAPNSLPAPTAPTRPAKPGHPATAPTSVNQPDIFE